MSKQKIIYDNIYNSESKRKNVIKNVFRIVFIVLFLLVLTFSYTFLFSGSSKSLMFGASAAGVLNERDFQDADSGDLILINRVNDINDLKINDVVVYKINGKPASAMVVEIVETNQLLKISRNDEYLIISFDIVLGTQGRTIGVIGYFWGFFGSIAGVITVSILFLAYVIFITFARVNEESTAKGKALLKQYKLQQIERKNREKLLNKFRKTDGFSLDDSIIIDGSMGDNLLELVAFSGSKNKGDVSSAYKYILDKVYRSYMFKEKLNKVDKSRITNAIEMSPVVDSFDEDMRYKLIDLILLGVVNDFDIDGYEKLATKFLSKPIVENDIINFGSVLYVLLYKNEKLRKTELKNVALMYESVVKKQVEQSQESLQLAKQILILFNKKVNIKKIKGIK